MLDLGNQSDRNLKQSKVSIIILNWNKYEETIECLDSLRKITYPNYGIILVDNGSEGPDVKILGERYGNYINIIKNDKNYGFAEGCNIGLRYALANHNPDYILLLNNDTIVDPDFLTELVQVAGSDLSIGIVGPKIYVYQGANRQGANKIQSAGGKINWWSGLTIMVGFNEIDSGQFDEVRDRDWVTGCSLLIKSSIIREIGFIYAPYFTYFEEIDWCVRCRRAGYKIVYIPTAKIWHKKHLISGKMESRALYYSTRNRFLFMSRNATRLQFMSFVAHFFFREALEPWKLSVRQRDVKLLLNYWRGTYDGIKLIWGRGIRK